MSPHTVSTGWSIQKGTGRGKKITFINFLTHYWFFICLFIDWLVKTEPQCVAHCGDDAGLELTEIHHLCLQSNGTKGECQACPVKNLMNRRKRIMRKKLTIWGFSLNSVGHLLKENEATKVFFSLRLIELKLFTGLKCFSFILYTFYQYFSLVFRIKLVDALKLKKIPKVLCLCFSLTCFSSCLPSSSLSPLHLSPFLSLPLPSSLLHPLLFSSPLPSSPLFPFFLLPSPPFPINQNPLILLVYGMRLQRRPQTLL